MFSHFTQSQLVSAVVVLIFLVVVAVVGFVHRRGTRTRASRNSRNGLSTPPSSQRRREKAGILRS